MQLPYKIVNLLFTHTHEVIKLTGLLRHVVASYSLFFLGEAMRASFTGTLELNTHKQLPCTGPTVGNAVGTRWGSYG